MATLVSPGVEVTITDESAYASPGTGTIPLVVVATAQDKEDPTGTETDGIAKYTKTANAHKVVPVTSQRELVQFFGNPTFESSEGAETSEYGLLAAYSYLGLGSQAYIVRANLDLGQLSATTTAPVGTAPAASYWIDTNNSSFGIHQYNGTSWITQSVTVEFNSDATSSDVAGSYVPTTPVVDGEFLAAVLFDGSTWVTYYYKGVNGSWVLLGHGGAAAGTGQTFSITGVTSDNQAVVTAPAHGLADGEKVKITGVGGMTQINDTIYTVNVLNGNQFSLFNLDGTPTNTTAFNAFTSAGVGERYSIADGSTVTYAAHHDVPESATTGDVWIKTTAAGGGLDLGLYQADTNGVFGAVEVEGVSSEQGGSGFVSQDGASSDALVPANGNALLALNAQNLGGFAIQTSVSGIATNISGTVFADDAEPTGMPVDGTLWFDDTATAYDILKVTSTGWMRVAANDVIYQTDAPTNNPNTGGALNGDSIWIDTNDANVPATHKWTGSSWMRVDNTDQSTPDGCIFMDITDDKTTASGLVVADVAGAPDYRLYPNGMLAINMLNSGNTVRAWDATVGKWRNGAANHADGRGSFGRHAQRKVISVAMQAAIAGNEDLRDPARNFTLLVAPNMPEVTDELVTLNTDRGETGYIIVDAPMRKTPTEAVAWVQGNGAAENGDDGLVTKYTYSAVYYPSGRSTTPAGDTVTVPASHMVLYQYVYNDQIAFPWFAPAGLLRGTVRNASTVGYITGEEEFKAISLSQGQRDSMYINKLNPIANFPAEGVVLYGQKSLHQFDSALDRVNVGRLVAYLRERLDDITRPFLFEQNDKQTRDRAKNVVETFLLDILAKRGLYDFAVVCDESNNTPGRIDRNELYIDVAIEPTKSVEFIYIPIRIVNTGTL